VNKLIRKIIGRDIGQILGFKIVVEIMAALGYPRAWVEYIKNREEMTMFFISLASVNSISEEKRGMILDVGCGPGQILSALSRKKNLREIVGIDRSFVSLLLARKFFASPQDLLICADVEAGLPLIDGSINTIFCTDTFHYFRKKTSFLKESFRVLKSTGVLYLQHIVNSNSLKFGNIRGTTPRRLKEMLGKTGFKVSHFYPNSLLWQNLKDHNFLDLKTRDLFAKAEESFAFSCYVSKDVLSARLRLNPQERRLVVRKKFNLAIDRELWKEVKVLQSRPNDQSD
jgi:ubiquinone/menaquinone biosynthesis C-methylase UbiE